ncbi:MAG: hypothetical protein QM813_26650 [Verrucomicrobiota bacterium]
MSLINDALKRAKDAQQENPPATPPLEFRPVEPGQQSNPRQNWLLFGLALVVIAILGLSTLLVRFIAQSRSNELQVAARMAEVPAASNPPVEAPPVHAVAEVVVAPTPPASSELPAEPSTNSVPVVAAHVEENKPAPLKLQGIFFNPQNPSAVVSGRSVYLGDRVGGFRVMGISPVAVTMVSATATNVLSLSE